MRGQYRPVGIIFSASVAAFGGRAAISGRRERGRDGHGLLEVHRGTPVPRAHLPAVGALHGASRAHVHHGLDGEYHAGQEFQPRTAAPEVGHIGILVHIASDAVAHILAHHAEARRLGHGLHRVPDVAEALLGAGGGQAFPHALLPHGQKARHLGRHLPHRIGPGVVAHPAVHNGPGVDGDDVPFAQLHALRGNPVHDLVVHRGADAAREPAVTLERGNAALGANGLLGDDIQLVRSDAALHGLAHTAQGQGRHAAGFPHGLDLGRRFQLHCHGATPASTFASLCARRRR